MYRKLLLFIPIISIVFYSAALKWATDLKKKDCKCAQNWRLEYIKSYFMVGIVGSLLLVAGIFRESLMIPIKKYWTPFIQVAAVSYAAIGLSYYVDIQKSKCTCAENSQEKFMYIMAIIQVIAIGLLISSRFVAPRFT